MIILTNIEKNINKLVFETIQMKNCMELLQLDSGHLKIKLQLRVYIFVPTVTEFFHTGSGIEKNNMSLSLFFTSPSLEVRLEKEMTSNI